MLLLRVTDDRGAVTEHLAESFPYRIGRSSAADLRLEAPGVWDTHASLTLGAGGKFIVAAEGASLLLLNGASTTGAPLAAGDELTLGAARILVSLAPTRPGRLALAEAFVWLLLFGSFVAEIVLIILAG